MANNKRSTIFVEIQLLWRQFRDGMRNASKETGGFRQALGSLSGLVRGVALGALISLLGVVTGLARRLPQLALEVEKVRVRLALLAGGAGATEAHIRAIQDATNGMVDQLTAARFATQALTYEVARTPEEIAELARMVNIMTGGNIELAESFLYMISNGIGSIERLNEFGLSAANVRRRIRELQAANEDLTTDMAFAQAVIAEMREKSDQLAGSLDTTAASVERLSARWKNAWQDAGEAFLVEMTPILDLLDKIAEKGEQTGNRLENAFLLPQAHLNALVGAIDGLLSGEIKLADFEQEYQRLLEWHAVKLGAISTESTRLADKMQAQAAAEEAAAAAAEQLGASTSAAQKAMEDLNDLDSFAFEDVFDVKKAEDTVRDVSGALQGIAEVVTRETEAGQSDEMTDEDFAKMVLSQLKRAGADEEVVWAFRKASGLATEAEIARERRMVELVEAAARGDISASDLWRGALNVRGGGLATGINTTNRSGRRKGPAEAVKTPDPNHRDFVGPPTPGQMAAAQGGFWPVAGAQRETRVVLELKGDLADMVDARIEGAFSEVMDAPRGKPVPRARFDLGTKGRRR